MLMLFLELCNMLCGCVFVMLNFDVNGDGWISLCEVEDVNCEFVWIVGFCCDCFDWDVYGCDYGGYCGLG